MYETIKRSFIGGLIFLATIGIGIVGFATYTDLPTQNSGDTLNVDIWNNAITRINSLGSDINTIQSQISGLSNIPTGAIIPFKLSTCPAGWIAANGANGTPDLRGEFIRGLDSGRGVDPARTLGSLQQDMYEVHYHKQGGDAGTNASYRYGVTTGLGGTVYSDMYGLLWTNGNAVNTSTEGGTETRPRNVALLYCVKQ